MLDKIKRSEKIKSFFYRFCNFDPYDDLQKTEDLNGEMKFNMENQAFGIAGDGTEFLILEDGTVAMSGSEGDVGRIAESIEEFFSLLLNFPCFWDFLCSNAFLDENKERFRIRLAEAMTEYFADSSYEMLRNEVSRELDIPIDNDVVNNTALKLYKAAARQPRFGYYYEDEFYDKLLSDYCFWC